MLNTITPLMPHSLYHVPLALVLFLPCFLMLPFFLPFLPRLFAHPLPSEFPASFLSLNTFPLIFHYSLSVTATKRSLFHHTHFLSNRRHINFYKQSVYAGTHQIPYVFTRKFPKNIAGQTDKWPLEQKRAL